MIPTLLVIGFVIGLLLGTRWTLVVVVGIVVTFAGAVGLAVLMDESLRSVFRGWVVGALSLIAGGLVAVGVRGLFGPHPPRSAMHY